MNPVGDMRPLPSGWPPAVSQRLEKSPSPYIDEKGHRDEKHLDLFVNGAKRGVSTDLACR